MSQINRPINRPLPPTIIPQDMYLGFSPDNQESHMPVYDIIANQGTLGLPATLGNTGVGYETYLNITTPGVLRLLFVGARNTLSNGLLLYIRVTIDSIVNDYEMLIFGKPGGAPNFQGGFALAGSLCTNLGSNPLETGFALGNIPFEQSLLVQTRVANSDELKLAMCSILSRNAV